ncbi:MAG: hypothetical protein IPG45_36440 [Deltaproteobacteria bacterium]|nr:hypothetical protein [Deltaproteobacteria bacterium]
MRRLLRLALLLAGACASADAGRSVETPPPPAPPVPPAPNGPVGPLLQDLHPEGAIGPRCLLQPELEVRSLQEGLEVLVALRNRDVSDHQVELLVDCPGGPVRFSGLSPGYDYYQTCNMGPCFVPDPPLRLSVAAGATTPLTRIVLHHQKTGCQPNLQIGGDPLVARVQFLKASTMEVCEVGGLMLPGAIDQ